MVMKESEHRITTYHEAGHAIVGYLVPEHDPVYSVNYAAWSCLRCNHVFTGRR
ncbi:hypothetical protein THIOSC15_2150005 [uncultured Thiomicrorhabdus sp.]